MKITRVEASYCDNTAARRDWQRKFWQFGVEVETDLGVTGIGV